MFRGVRSIRWLPTLIPKPDISCHKLNTQALQSTGCSQKVPGPLLPPYTCVSLNSPSFLYQANSCSSLQTQPRCYLFRQVFPNFHWSLPRHHVLTLTTLRFTRFYISLFIWCYLQSWELHANLSLLSRPNKGPDT